MNFKVGQFLQYVHLKPIRTGMIASLPVLQFSFLSNNKDYANYVAIMIRNKNY